MAKITIYEMSRKNLGTMTTNELKNYIRDASKKVAKDRGSRYNAVSESAEYIAESVGMRSMKDKETGKIRRELKLGFKGMRKKDLLGRARLLQGHFKIDVYSRDAQKYIDQVTEEAMERLYQNTGVKLETKEEMANFKLTMSQIKDIIEKFGSDNIAKMYDEIKQSHGERSAMTIGMAAIEVFDNLPKGVSQKDAMDALSTYLELMLGEM